MRGDSGELATRMRVRVQRRLRRLRRARGKAQERVRLGQGVMTRSMTKALARERETQVESEEPEENHHHHGHGGAPRLARAVRRCVRTPPPPRQAGCHHHGRLQTKIWGRLPEDVLERICARLPTACLIRMRAVNRRWRAMLHGGGGEWVAGLDRQGFGAGMHHMPASAAMGGGVKDHAMARLSLLLQLYAQAPAPPPWFCMFTKIHRDACTYDALLNRWHQVPLPPLPASHHGRSSAATVATAAADAGLVCFCALSGDGCADELVVCNPLSRASVRLRAPPPLLLQPLRKLGLVADAASRTFRVLLAAADGRALVFDSATGAWGEVTGGGAPPAPGCCAGAGDGDEDLAPRRPDSPSTTTDCSMIQPPALCDGLLYWLAPDGLLEAFDPARCRWTHWYVAMPAPLVCCSGLVESQRSIYMLGFVGLPSKHICIWRLHRQTMQWQEVDRMPAMLCAEFVGESTHVNFTGSSQQVLLNMRGGQRNRLLVLYDLRTRLWRRVPKCPLPDSRLVWGLKDGVAFRPRIDADLYLL